jgi:predicted transcriptional regulator
MSRSKPEVYIGAKKELKRIEWNTVKRIIVFLYYNNQFGKTRIAMQCNMAYDKFILYLDWMEVMDLVKREVGKDGYEVLSLTERGNNLFSKKFQENKIILERNILQA